MDTGQNHPNPPRAPSSDEKRNQPPYWLEVSDESWGPTDMRKRKARPIPLPEIPTFSSEEEDFGFLHALVLVVIVLLLGWLIYWLRE